MPKFHEAMNAAKRDLIEKAFAQSGGDYKKAGAALGLNPRSLYRMLRDLKLTHLLK